MSKPVAFPLEAEDVPFSPTDVLKGVHPDWRYSNQPGRLTVECQGDAEILRFYGSRRSDSKPPIIYLSGDVVERCDLGFRVRPGYENASPATLQFEAASLSSSKERTFVFLARPGKYGSSGNHMHRRRLREICLVDRAISRLSDAFGWAQIDLAGLSGGGHLAACLLARRKDVRHTVIASGNIAVGERLRLLGLQRDVTGFEDFVDPITQVNQIAANKVGKLVLLTDPEDQVVPASVQMAFAASLREAGADFDHHFVSAPQSGNHILYDDMLSAIFALGETQGK